MTIAAPSRLQDRRIFSEKLLKKHWSSATRGKGKVGKTGLKPFARAFSTPARTIKGYYFVLLLYNVKYFIKGEKP